MKKIIIFSFIILFSLSYGRSYSWEKRKQKSQSTNIQKKQLITNYTVDERYLFNLNNFDYLKADIEKEHKKLKTLKAFNGVFWGIFSIGSIITLAGISGTNALSLTNLSAVSVGGALMGIGFTFGFTFSTTTIPIMKNRIQTLDLRLSIADRLKKRKKIANKK